MQQNLTKFSELNIQYAIGSSDILDIMKASSSIEPFNEEIIEFLNEVSKILLSDHEAKAFPDVITLAFWMRKSSVITLKNRFVDKTNNSVITLGRGVAFHIAPSNVPVNYAYSLVTGLLCGNRNIVRIPTKDFEQVQIINKAFNKTLNKMPDLKSYICLVNYGHDSVINDALTSIADVRIIWGGDNTICEIRKSPMKPRATEITFADRYSLVVIDSDKYMNIENKSKVANEFYNDTYLTDQNACTSPRVVVWIGQLKEDAKNTFWSELHNYIDGKYEISGVQAVNKLTSGYILAASKKNVKKVKAVDNLIVRMKVSDLTDDLMELKDNSGYFFEYDCNNIIEIKDFCNNTRCQTLSYIGEPDIFKPLILEGVSGIDRIVPVGKTMDFDFIWDGYNLFERLTRNVVLQ